MNRLSVVTKYFIKNALGEMFGSSKKKSAFLVALMIFGVSMISMPFTMMVGLGYKEFHAAGQEGMLLSLIISAGATVCFFFGIYTIMNVFYFSDDIEVLLPLPIKSSELVIGKFVAVLINMYIYTAMLILPLVAFGVVSKATIVYYLYVIIVLIITPILPMVLASIICMILMRFTSLSKHKDGFRMFTGCATLILIVVFNYLNSGSKGNMTQEQALLKFSEGHNSMMDMMTGIFITSKFSSYGLLYNNETRGLIYILLGLILSIIIFIIYSYIGGKLYLKGIIGISESYSKKENILENGKVKKFIQINSPLKALVIKDIKIMFRTPTYFINCIAMIFYMPAILGVAMLSRSNISEIRNMLSQGTSFYGFVIVGAFVLASMSVMTGGASATALSREGRDILVSKYIPVSYKTQLYSKIISSVCINGAGSIIVAIALVIIGVSPLLFILGFLVSVAAILVISLFGIFIDFKSPKLEWENEKAMFKKNYMPLLIMFIIFVISAILVVLNILIQNYMVIFGICMILALIGSFILYKILIKLVYKVYLNDK
ncbi:putative ABC transporter permease subunit [Clostridium saccharoperbutylacetonicum]|uniref:putative ABC transporter permease subunit n=1 Tax=Clostridium saccharoperbutylacetonicum TaxID=36745 RepID=UPI0039E915C9